MREREKERKRGRGRGQKTREYISTGGAQGILISIPKKEEKQEITGNYCRKVLSNHACKYKCIEEQR